MKNFLYLLLLPFLFAACGEGAVDLPEPDAVMVKFENKTGENIEGLVVSRANIGDLGKGKTTGEYYRFETLGQQFGYALVEAVGTINGKRHFTASACQGVCGTDSAPHGTWLEPGYYRITIHLPPAEKNTMEFRMKQ